MATHQRDLWPADIAVTANLQTPVTILREQALLLGEKTKNVVEAEVISGGNNIEFTHSFILVAPALENYKYRLFTVRHPVELYPLWINFDSWNEEPSEVDSEEEFVKELKVIFAHKRTKDIIQALIAQSQ